MWELLRVQVEESKQSPVMRRKVEQQQTQMEEQQYKKQW